MATTLRDALAQLRRRAAPPGAAAQAGLPVDRAREAGAELVEVFAAVDEVRRGVEAVERSATLRADEEMRVARAAAGLVAARAVERVQAARAEAVAARRLEHEQEIRTAIERARAEAECIARRSDELIPELVRRVTLRVRAAGSAGGGDAV